MGSTFLVEAIRFILTLAFTAGSYRFAQSGGRVPGITQTPEAGVFMVTAIGTGIGYVFGGVAARTVNSTLKSAESRLAQRHASELVAGTLGLLVGLVGAALIAWPILLAPLRPEITYSAAALVMISLAAFGTRFAIRKRLELFGVLGVGPTAGAEAPPGGCLLDSSAAIDGRILALWRASLLPAPVCVPSFVIWELQGIADSEDPLRRRRGQRGLDVLASLREAGASVLVIEEDPAATTDADAKLVIVARRRGLPIVTSDSNLAKAAELQGLRVLNMHALAELLRPPVVPGEHVKVHLIKEGRDPGQGVGYLDDGTMVVVERATAQLGHEVEVEVSSVLQNPQGRMLFARLAGEGGAAPDLRKVQ